MVDVLDGRDPLPRAKWSKRVLRIVTAASALVLALSGAWRIAGAAGDKEDRPEPDSAPLWVTVEEGRLEDIVVARANLVHDAAVRVRVAQPADGRDPVLTALPPAGTRIGEGEVLYELAGRPVFVLASPVPAYRDLAVEDRGADVARLQEALRRLGHYRGPVDGEYGFATAAALGRLYRASGHELPVSKQVRQELRAMETEQREAGPGPDQGGPESGNEADSTERRQQLRQARMAAAVPFLRREFLLVPELPATVQSVNASVGDTVETGADLMQVGGARLRALIPYLDSGFSSLVGRQVLLHVSEAAPFEGIIERTAIDERGDDVLVATAPELQSGHAGLNVKAVIVRRVGLESGLLIPMQALVLAPDGRTYVDKRVKGDALLRVEVTITGRGTGKVAIRPAKSGALRSGEYVRLHIP